MIYVYNSLVITIKNESEHNITWVMIINARNGYAYLSEKDNELIAKNGNSKSFDLKSNYPQYTIVCVKAEDIPEFMCTDEFDTYYEETKTFIWNGSDDPAWKPIRYID